MHKLLGILRTVHSRKIEYEITALARLIEKLCGRLDIVKIKLVHRKSRMSSVLAVLPTVPKA